MRKPQIKIVNHRGPTRDADNTGELLAILSKVEGAAGALRIEVRSGKVPTPGDVQEIIKAGRNFVHWAGA